jgi:outer membrane receptor protein involved in Fe transport
MRINNVSRSVRLAILGAASTVMLTSQAYATQEESIEKTTIQQTKITEIKVEDEKDEVEKIVVTGSRLRRDSFSVVTPLVKLGQEAIADTGLGSLSEILLDEMPMVEIDASNTTTQSSVSNTGLSTFNLRNLGADRALTLIDGRRVVSNSYSANKVSLSTIPVGMIQSIEIITGGASAAYGSDAMAGVVNIITQQYKEGASFKARGGTSSAGGAEEFSLNFDYGSEFDGDRGYMFFSANYDKQYGLSFSDRKRAQQQASFYYNPEQMCNTMLVESGDYECMNGITPADWRNLSDGVYGGVFGEYRKNDTQFWYDQNGLRSDWKGNEEKYGINSRQFVQLKVPDEALSLAFKADYEFSDDIQGYFQVQYSQTDSVNYKSPEDGNESSLRTTYNVDTGEFGEVNLGYIPMDNPYVPQEIRDAGLYKDRIYWDRRFNEVGRITTDNTRKTIRTWAGLQGTIFDGEWDWDVSVGYGQFIQKQLRLNEINVWNFRDAINAEEVDGVIQCKDETARANGCVPVNMFGENSISAGAADYIRSNPTIENEITQLTFSGYMTGDLFELPAGTVTSAVGFEYREDTQDLFTNVPEGGVTFNYVPSFYGEVNVKELFGEAALPLLKNVDGFKRLDLEVSGRVSDYSWSGTGLVKSYKAGLIWEIAEGYVIRGNYARAQRAPGITELMSPPRGDYDRFSDICDGVTATSTLAGHANCRLEPGIAAQLALDPNFKFEDENNSYSPSAGNLDLHEETADTYTLGFTLSPEIFRGFKIAVDYYDIKITDAISSIDNNDIISSCYASSLAWGDDNPYCQDIKRDDEGQIIEVMQRQYNIDAERSTGYDVVVAYEYDMDEYGKLNFQSTFNHVIERSTTIDTPDGVQTTNFEGDLNYGVYENKASASLTWSKDDWRVRWSTSFKDSLEDKFENDLWDEYTVENDERCAAASADCVQNPEALKYNKISSYMKHSINVAYSMDLEDGSRLSLSGGIKNIFDNNGDWVPWGMHYMSAYGGGVGRFYHLSAKYKF